MNFFNFLPAAAELRPALPMGCLFDIPTGCYVRGKHGESLLNTGMSLVNGVSGPGNSFKSEVTNALTFTPLARLAPSKAIVYDTENSMSYERLNRTMSHLPNLSSIQANDPNNGKVYFTQSADIMGDKWFTALKEIAKERIKDKQNLLCTTPFIDSSGKNIQIMEPLIITIDSLSEFKVTSTQEKVVDGNDIGESATKIQFMNDGLAKTQLITQLPNLASQAGLYFNMVAQTGMKIEMGGMFAPKETKMAHAKNGYKSKGVPDKWSFINNNLFEIFNAKPLLNGGPVKIPLYPPSPEVKDKESVDLNVVSVVNVRNKNGASGFKFELIISQSEGLLSDLTMFHYIKEHGKYGITGNNTSYHLDLLPGIKLTRTNVRSRLKESQALCRAVQITAQMYQMEVLWANLDAKLHCTPQDLYTDLKAAGYDWAKLLDTRDYWVFEEDKVGELPYVSTMDLLRMRTSDYALETMRLSDESCDKK